VRTIYITPAGKTATHHVQNYFENAIRAFGPLCGMVILTSKDMRESLEAGIITANYEFPTDILSVDNPFSDTADYYEVLSQLMETIANIASCYKEDIRCVVNCSGGTTKLTMWMFDLSNILARIIPTRAFFATFDPNENKVIFTERPLLSEKIIKEIFGEKNDSPETKPENPAGEVTEPDPDRL